MRVATTLANVAGFVVHVAALAIIGVLVTGTIVAPVQLPRVVLLAVVAGLGVLAGAVFWSPLVIGADCRPPSVRWHTVSWLPGAAHGRPPCC